jgi:hypothetical protein
MEQNFANQITPENILDITIQYKLTNSQVQVAIPSIYVRYGLVNVRQASISLSEVMPYIKYLQIQAAVLGGGRTIVATQIDENLKTVLSVGFSPVTPEFTGNVTFTLNGINFTITEGLANVINLSGSGVATRGFSNSPFIASFSIPRFTNDFNSEYNFTGAGINIYCNSTANGANWDVICTGSVGADGNYTIAFTLINEFIHFIIHPDWANNLIIYGAVLSHLVDTVLDFYLPKEASYFFETLEAINGSLHFAQKAAGITLNELSNVAIGDGLTVFDNTVDEIDISKDVITLDNNVTSQQLDKVFFISSSGSYFSNVPVNGNTVAFLKTNGNIIHYNLGANDSAGFTYLMDVVRGGITLQTISGLIANGANQNTGGAIDPANYNYDLLRFYRVATGAGFPVTVVGQAVTAVNICAAGDVLSEFTDDGTVTTGKIVYANVGLTIPLAGYDFIVAPDGNIFAIDNVTGLVGAATGGTCNVPIAGKNMQVVGTASTHLDVDGNDYGAKGAGSNYNVVIKSGSVITNNSGGSRTFNFYTTPPFIGGNLTPGSGSPVVVANAGTITLPNDISNYNYVVVT